MKGEPCARAGRGEARPPARRASAARLRGEGGVAARGVPAARRGHDRSRGRGHPTRVAGPVRPGARAGRAASGGRPTAGRVRAARHHRSQRHQGPGVRWSGVHRTSCAGAAQDEPDHPADASVQGAVYKADSGRLVLPVPRTPDLAGTLVDFLRQLLPPAAGATGDGNPPAAAGADSATAASA